jgi:hypothetical protein
MQMDHQYPHFFITVFNVIWYGDQFVINFAGKSHYFIV